ncbi:MAG: hypothetical protein EOO91_04805 [Pedobacter sp.]|nr:MAG: hypothetical protein EOO91_04805 [Pedobacter sp.]
MLSFDTSLRETIKQKIDSEHKDLQPSFSDRFAIVMNYLSKRNNWWMIFGIVVALFLILTFANIGLLSFISLSDKTTSIIIDQRISNVATIVSMTMAVIGLLLSNLAVKDSQTYKLVFIRSRLYLILYYTLSVIFCLIVTSTLRDTIKDADIYGQAVLAGTYLSLTILFAIGYLFRRIIHFANPSKIQEILKRQWFEEARKNLLIHLMEKYSHATFIELMKKHNVEELSALSLMRNAKMFTMVEGTAKREEKVRRTVYDVDMANLNIQLSNDKFEGRRFYHGKIGINMLIELPYEYISYEIKDARKNSPISSFFITKPEGSQQSYDTEYKNYFENKLYEYSTEGKASKVEEILTMYAELYLFQMKHDKK